MSASEINYEMFIRTEQERRKLIKTELRYFGLINFVFLLAAFATFCTRYWDT